MAKFLMLGKYSVDAIKGISAERTEKASNLIKKHGGIIHDAFALLGDRDLAVMMDLPGIAEAIKVSIELTKLSGIAFTTYPAIAVAEFDKMMA